MGRKHAWKRRHLLFYVAGCLIICVVMAGCAQVFAGKQLPEDSLSTVNAAISAGDFTVALFKNQLLMEKSEKSMQDALLYQRGIIFCHPMNPDPDYPKALDAFQTLLRRNPDSCRRHEINAWIGVLTQLRKIQMEVVYLEDRVRLQMRTIRENAHVIDALQDKNRIVRVQGRRLQQLEALQEEVKVLQDQIEQLKQIDIEIEQEKRTVVPK